MTGDVVYHITEKDNLESIYENGLEATDYLGTFQELELGPSLESLKEYAGTNEENVAKRAFAEYLFEDRRPSELPSRGAATYFYANPTRAAFEATISPLDIRVVRIDTAEPEKEFVAGTEVWSAYPIVRALKATQVNGHSVSIKHLREAIDFYWEESKLWEGKEHPKWEVYYPSSIPPHAIKGDSTPEEVWGN